MNKLAIPGILAATLLIAGIFALMPVERASTVHTGLEAKIDTLQEELESKIISLSVLEHTDEDQDDGDRYVIDCTTGFVVTKVIVSMKGTLNENSLHVLVGENRINEEDEDIVFNSPNKVISYAPNSTGVIYPENIVAPATDDVILAASETNDDDDEKAVILLAVQASSGGTCTLRETTTG